MTQQEQQLLSGLIDRVNGTQLASKDVEAENLLSTSFARNPDAVYILCQTLLVQQFAMDNAQRQLTAARAEIESLKQAKPQEHGSFLGNLFGLNKTDDAPQQPAPPPQPPAGYASQPTGYAPVHSPAASPIAPPYGYAQQPPPPGYGYGAPGGYPQPGYGGPMGGGGGMFGGGGGFLQGAMQTAAGVVAGEFAFRAIEDVFHGFGGGGGRGFGGGNEVVNNYYDNDSASHDGGFGDRLQGADNLGNGLSPDIEDRRGDAHGFTGGDDGTGTSAFASDDNDFSGDNSGGDDSGNYADDSSYSDDSGGGDNSF